MRMLRSTSSGEPITSRSGSSTAERPLVVVRSNPARPDKLWRLATRAAAVRSVTGPSGAGAANEDHRWQQDYGGEERWVPEQTKVQLFAFLREGAGTVRQHDSVKQV